MDRDDQEEFFQTTPEWTPPEWADYERWVHLNLNWRPNMSNDLNALSFDALVPSESKYLKKEDVGEDGLIVTIEGFSRETLEADGTSEEKIVMHFAEDLKPMVLNRTNAQLLSICTGAKVAGDARGKKVVVYNDPTVGFGGKITGGIRIKKVAGEPRQASKPMARPAAVAASTDDDVPF